VKACGKLGVVSMSHGRLDQATGLFWRAIQVKPDDAQLRSNLGVVLVRQGRLKEAPRHFSEALKITPDDENARYNL
jgi:Flp pilus assembly protein TadD